MDVEGLGFDLIAGFDLVDRGFRHRMSGISSIECNGYLCYEEVGAAACMTKCPPLKPHTLVKVRAGLRAGKAAGGRAQSLSHVLSALIVYYG